MFESYVSALAVLLAAATLTWLLSVPLKAVSIVDTSWPLQLFAAGVLYALAADPRNPRLSLVLWLLASWAARLALHFAIRNRRHGEDRRHRELRSRHQPRFALKSLYLLFWPRAVLAWVVSLPLLGALHGMEPLNALDFAGLGLWAVGFGLAATSDWRLARFRKQAANDTKVLDHGLWRYSRHPNYFGECCLWWGFGLMSAAAGAWWGLFGPLVLTLLLRIPAVAGIEREAGNRRPAYVDYVRKTRVFFPGPRRK